MAFPTVATQFGGTFLTDVTNHNVNLPATVNAGELLLCLFCNDGSATVTTPSGWTQRWSVANGSELRLSAYYRIADGSEGGTQVNFVTSAAERAVARGYRITNWHGTSAPEAATATGSTSTPDPPALTPSWGAQDTLWLACHGRSSSVTLSSYPANYSNGTNDSTGSGTTHAQLSAARRELNAASENPGVFTLSGSAAWVAATVAIRPVVSQTQTMGAATATADAPSATATLKAALQGSEASAAAPSTTAGLSAALGQADAQAQSGSVIPALSALMGAAGAQAESGSITYTAAGGVLMGAVGAQAEAPALLASLIASAASAGAQAEAPSLLASLVALAASTGAQAGAPSLLTSLAAQAALAQASAGAEAIAAFQVVALQQAQALAEAPSITVVLPGLIVYVYLQGHSAPVLFNLGHHAPTHYLIGTQVGMLHADAHYALSLYLRGQTDIIRLEGRS